jgi:hypothetical protein
MTSTKQLIAALTAFSHGACSRDELEAFLTSPNTKPDVLEFIRPVDEDAKCAAYSRIRVGLMAHLDQRARKRPAESSLEDSPVEKRARTEEEDDGDDQEEVRTKKCSACHEVKPVSEFHVRLARNGWTSRCKPCAKVQKKQSIERNRHESTVLEKECSDCKVTKPISEFHKNASRSDGTVANCKECKNAVDRKISKQNMQNADKFVKVLVKSCRSHDKDLGRVNDLTAADIHRKFAEQNSRCHATNVPIFLRQGPWQVSADRIVGGSGGHTNDNVVLTALEVNTRIKWTQDFTKELIAKSEEEFGDYHAIADLVRDTMTSERESGPRRKWTVTLRDDVEFVYCHTCGVEKEREQFYDVLSRGCKECESKSKKAWYSTWKGVFQRLLNHSRSSTAVRNAVGRDHEHDIDLDYLVDMFVEQEGRCYYSRAPLATDGYFKCSLERKNINLGYVKGNVCIIIVMLNSTDHYGDTSWSREKFEHMKACN